MSDNTSLYPGAGGHVIRDLDRAGVHTQINLIDVGGTGPENILSAGQKSMANSLPVTLASDQPNMPVAVAFQDTHNIDSFGRLRISAPSAVFDCQFNYDLQPLVFEQITSGAGATITYDGTNGHPLMTFASTPTGGSCYMQTFQYYRYQPGKSQKINITFNFLGAIANCLKFVGYSDDSNGISFQNNGVQNQFVIYSTTANGNQTVGQSSWNMDKLDGTGASGLTLDITKTQQLVIDLQALYVGRVRIGFDINGTIIYAHQFLFANTIGQPYIRDANLPIRCGMTCTGTVSTTMFMQCCAIASEGGTETVIGYEFEQENVTPITVASGVNTHIMSLQPRLTFAGRVNRATVYFIEIDMLNAGNNPLYWELVIGQALTTPAFADVDTNYSAVQYDVAGTLSGVPIVSIDSGFIPATNQSKGANTMNLTFRYPITLDHLGAVRTNGRISLIARGLGGATSAYGAMKWVEVR